MNHLKIINREKKKKQNVEKVSNDNFGKFTDVNKKDDEEEDEDDNDDFGDFTTADVFQKLDQGETETDGNPEESLDSEHMATASKGQAEEIIEDNDDFDPFVGVRQSSEDDSGNFVVATPKESENQRQEEMNNDEIETFDDEDHGGLKMEDQEADENSFGEFINGSKNQEHQEENNNNECNISDQEVKNKEPFIELAPTSHSPAPSPHSEMNSEENVLGDDQQEEDNKKQLGQEEDQYEKEPKKSKPKKPEELLGLFATTEFKISSSKIKPKKKTPNT